ncbi:MAG: DUF2182 domain-containing protein [Anaerolineales bacterium]|nr:DUF2182 domain-containing protein [Anaerolineales bacterium]
MNPAGLSPHSRRDRWLVLFGLVGITVVAWAYLLQSGRGMRIEAVMPPAGAEPVFEWTPTLAMWSVMMVAMMLPSAAPAILLFDAISRQSEPPLPLAVPVFTFGYLAGWIAFSLLATLAQSALYSAALLSPAMSIVNPAWSGALLVAAGLFQWTPLKSACLSRCRSPRSLFMTEWRGGLSGAFRLGLKHSGYCLGCCGLLMALLFVVGSLNLIWVAVVATGVLVEKLAPSGRWISRIAGVLLFALGVWHILQPAIVNR